MGHEIAFAHNQSPLCCIKKSLADIKKQFEKNKELLNFSNTINQVSATLHMLSYILLYLTVYNWSIPYEKAQNAIFLDPLLIYFNVYYLQCWGGNTYFDVFRMSSLIFCTPNPWKIIYVKAVAANFQKNNSVTFCCNLVTNTTIYKDIV